MIPASRTDPAVHRSQAAPADPFTALIPSPAANLPIPSPTATLAARMTVQEVLLVDGTAVPAYVPAPAPVTIQPAHRPAYRAGEDPVVMRSLAGGALLAGGGVGAMGASLLLPAIGPAIASIGQAASGTGGLILGGVALFAYLRSASSGRAAAASATAPAVPATGTTTITKHVTTGPQVAITARKVRIKHLTPSQHLDF
ncbi:hypothetical protein ACFZDG_35655 [Kitasatospora xanthocidica]|uniref:hypothetical protein n=1 Tax=Kitasatospora xanthocidica TaxID=83382 RepID=UPI0036E41B25